MPDKAITTASATPRVTTSMRMTGSIGTGKTPGGTTFS